MKKESPIRVKSFRFACDIVKYCDELKSKKDFEISSQLLRSGTSIGANAREAQIAEKVERILDISLESL